MEGQVLSSRHLIVKCSHCKKLFSAETFDSHECDLPFNDCEDIPVVYFRDYSYKNKQIMTGLGINGTYYRFVVEPRTPIPCVTRRIFTESETDDNFTEPKRR